LVSYYLTVINYQFGLRPSPQYSPNVGGIALGETKIDN